MTVSGRAKSVRRNRRTTSQMISAGLVSLAVAASLFMIFSDSVKLLRVGLVVALWAATLGAIAMTKYRRESAREKAKVRDLQKVYELQLEREISARREYELGVEVRVRGEMAAEAETIKALRDELSALRRNLEMLFDGRLPEDRVALRAESTRVQELAGSYHPAASGLFVPGAQPPGPNAHLSGPDAQVPSPDLTRHPTPQGPGFATPYDDPVTAETTAVIPAIDVEAVDGLVVNDFDRSAVNHLDSPMANHRAGAAAESTAADIVLGGPETPLEEPLVARLAPEYGLGPMGETAEPKAEPPTPAAPSHTPERDEQGQFRVSHSETPRPVSRRARRLAEDSGGAHTNGLSVAEIMANLKSDDTGEGAVPPHTRHRAE
ncbi:DUF6779 domain-containing protein [Rhodococcus spongiicola]|uniref:DUF6779 domain-containing protein n=1 Tax=Rhodococcus spongiicola TaxID=2487352 RepID=A0A3S3E6S5_9NOCA|nr:DUF6779 domain-containing protein [Rhodococcus spongiicola]RVW06652.1 hypothetical protein EF834_04465 [Rhodococcus spongiicola]